MGILRDDDIGKTVGPAVPYGSQFGKFATKHDLPEGAVVLSRTQMREFAIRTISKWQPKSEMWSFTYGTGLQASGAILGGVYFNAVLRQKFKLQRFGPVLTFGPTCIIPTITALMVQQSMVTTKLLLNEFDCPSCAQIRSSTLMVATGFLQPLCLSLLTCSIISRYKYTITLPKINDPKNLFAAYAKMLRPFHLPMLGIILVNMGLGVFVTQQQQMASAKVHKRLSGGHY